MLDQKQCRQCDADWIWECTLARSCGIGRTIAAVKFFGHYM